MIEKIMLRGLFLSILVSSASFAFDNKRAGFMVGVGFGANNTTYKPYDKHNKIGLSTSQKIGYGFSEKVLVFISRDDTWYSNDTKYINCVTGIGSSYYFSNDPQSLYISGSIGKAFLTNRDDETRDDGFGVVLGIGYEFINHLNLETNVMISDIKSDHTEVDPVSFRIMASYYWY